MNQGKKILALGALLLTLAIAVACAAPGTVPTSAPPTAAAPAATAATGAQPTAAATAAAGEATAVPTPVPTIEREAKGGEMRVSDSGYQGTLNLWVLGYTPGNAFANPFDNAVEQFEKDNPGINVEITGYPPNDEGFTKLSTALQSGQGIDLLRLPSDRLPGFVADDLIEPIDPFLTDADKADILPNVLDVTRVGDGQAYAWPLWVVPMGMYVNKTVFEEAGVPLPPKDWTWDQFVEAAKATTFTRANGENVYGWSGFVDPGVVNTWGLWMNQDPSVRPVREDGSYGLNSEEAYAGLQRIADLALVHKVTPPDFGSMKDADVKGGFTNGQLAMIVDATGPAAQFKGAGVDFDIYPLPTFNGNKLTVGAVGLIAVAKQSDDVKKNAAMDLARYLTSGEVQEDVPPGSNVPTGFYLAPGARQSVEVVEPLNAFIPVLPDMWITPLVVDWAKFTRLIHPEYQNILFGQQTPQEGMEKIAAEAAGYLGAGGQ
jgi:multiple sugar transport system substrate-binding protein